MFPEYRELISELKVKNPRFNSLFEKHNKLDHEIKQIEGHDGRGYSEQVAKMKLEKLEIKRELQKILDKESIR
ncbi:DUF465 domain-containing protein [Morganella morganii]|nr:DUF465 domain-containing protein [Morganella morganii]